MVRPSKSDGGAFFFLGEIYDQRPANDQLYSESLDENPWPSVKHFFGRQCSDWPSSADGQQHSETLDDFLPPHHTQTS